MSNDDGRDRAADEDRDGQSPRSGPEDSRSETGSRVHGYSGAAAVSGGGGPGPEEGAGSEMSKSESAKKEGSFWKELPILIAIALVLTFVIRTWVMQAFYIPSSSMENTLLIGDKVLVNRLVYEVRDVERGEIVVFNGEDSWDDAATFVPEPTNPFSAAFTWVQQQMGVAPTGKDYIKRVIGLPGDVVECCDEQNRVTVNGVPLDEEAYLHPGALETHDPFGPITVPEGHLWVMGDNRGVSGDSRDHQNDPGGGAVPLEYVAGRAFVIIWPLDQAGWLSVPETFEDLDSARQ
ncbi:signal peptidase I [Nocardiopsis sp. CNT312]|uniref:signal peptidase I n=1 Tax=Nocardiopsis sp. CNT312 TaxID=1137268 RepID=UPI00048F71BA|nr:signal peptidase I [Nocardiopsis sp. CNT312]